ncbi:MAG TPA: S-layer homology domain-containing protein, partial [Chloroflexia bacterium]|nr:S-layer homology domain-containing protein [Chloroflexia bacterium]
HLGYRWYTLTGQPVGGFQDLRTHLPSDVAYGASVTLQAQVGAPSAPGTYELRWDMVHELRTWFADAGSTPLSTRVTVASRDTTPPTARVLPLAPYQAGPSFTVSWGGADEPGGSGLASFDVQYRAGPAGAWTDWQVGNTATSATFSGAEGITYSFRARARDAAGNLGTYPAQGDTATNVATRPPLLEIRSPASGAQVMPGPLVVRGITDPGALVRVNEAAATVTADGTFSTTVEVSDGDFPITVQAQSANGKVTRGSVVVHAGGRFSDVPVSYWAYDAIDYLAAFGVISGYEDGTFKPEGGITRAQFMKMLAGALRWPSGPPARATFRDVPLAHWASAYIEAAVARQAVTGYADGTFRDGAPVTRAQVAKVLVLAAGWPLQEGTGSPFADVAVTHWAYPYIETAYRHGVIQDTGPGRFRPDAGASRAEVTVFLYYALGDLAQAGRWPP